MLAEPVLGEGGFVTPPPEYFPKLKKICDDNGILFIADEVQSGFGRTGKIFAIEHWGVVPDIITTAKSLASGYPLSGVTGRAEVMDAPHAGGLGGTYGGNPVACRAALAVFDIIEEEGLLERAGRIGDKVRATFLELQKEIPAIGDVRGLGAMIALELVDRPGHQRTGRRSDQGPDRAGGRERRGHDLSRHFRQRHPPADATDDRGRDLDRGLAIVAESLKEVAREAGLA